MVNRKRFFWVFLVLFVAVSGTMLIRTSLYTRIQDRVPHVEYNDIDIDTAVQRLSGFVQIPSVSNPNVLEKDTVSFLKLREYLISAFPLVHQHLQLEVVNNYSLLYTWQGSNSSLKPAMMIAHLDVVPADEDTHHLWTYHPFSGTITDGFVWGRGSMDDKSGVLSHLEAVEYLLGKGYTPRRTMYLGFGHDEEIDGQHGAKKISELLQQRGVELEFLLDEGLAIVEEIVEGSQIPFALIAIAEKGYLSLRLSIEKDGGHSSVPGETTAIGLLSKAIYDIEQNPLPGRLSGVIESMFEHITPDMPFSQRFFFANLWAFRSLIERQLESYPTTNAVLRTTIAPTIFQSGVRDNVLPNSASAIINFRIHPNDSVEKVKDHITRIVNDDRIQVLVMDGYREPTPISSLTAHGYKVVQRSIIEVFDNITVAPSLMVANTDAIHYLPLTKNIYRFRPIKATVSDLARIHGIDERMSVENYKQMIYFYIQVIKHSSDRYISTVR